jgi:tripartite-type tricarboxylate transporter receptor subunit TctC
MSASARKSVMPTREQDLAGNQHKRRPIPTIAHNPRRRFLSLAAGAAALPAVSWSAKAQAYPTRPITMIVPLAAGGGMDATARVLADRMRRSLGQPVIIGNVTGADGNIATARAARARADGYTIEIGNISTHALNGAFYSLSFDVLNDFTPISPIVTFASVYYGGKMMPAKDLPELIAWLKANPTKASAGIYSVGSRLMSEHFQKETGTQFTLVPYRGLAPALQDMAAGQVDICLAGLPAFLPLVRAGNIRAYAVTGERRLAAAPEIPTIGELGLPRLSWSTWFGLFAPKSTPTDVINKLNAAVVDALADAATRSRLVDLGEEIIPDDRQSPEALRALQEADIKKWWPLIKELGIKAE